MSKMTRFVRGLVVACCAALGLNAGAAMLTEAEGVYTVINTKFNDSNFGWTGVSSFTVTLPVKDGVFAEGDTYALSSIQIVKASGGNNNNENTPVTLTIAGITATRSDATGTDAAWDGGRTVSTYTFTGTKPILTVGSAATVATTGPGSIRACPTISSGDTDLLIGIGNNKQYQPLTKIVCEKITTTTATVSADAEGVDAIEWSNGAPSETNPGVLTINEGVTLSVEQLTSLNYVTLAGAGTVKATGSLTINRAYTSPVVFGAAWTGTLHLVGTTMVYCDFNKFAGVGKVKVTGVAGYLDNGKTFPGELILEDNGDTKALTVNNGDSNNYYAIQTLSGSGTFHCTNNGATQQTIIKSAADFTGTVTIEGTGKSVVFADVGGYQNNCNGSIVIGSGASVTIADGKTWSAGNKILINQHGTLTVPATFASAFKGAGRLAGYTAFTQVTDAVKTSLQDAAWTGSLVVTGATIQNGAVTSYKTTLNNFGNAGSKIEFAGSCNGYFGLSRLNAGDTEVAIKPELVISGTLALNDGFTQKDGYEYYYTLINKLSGTGTLSCSKGGINPLLFVKDGASYAGSITATNLKVVFGEPAETMTTVENNTLTIAEGQTATVAANKAFSAGNGVVVDGTLTVAANASSQVVDKLTIGENGTVSISRSDWFKFRTGSRQDIVIKGTLNLNSTRQTLYPNNPITLYPGATITANETSSDGGCHLNFYNAPVLKLVAEEGNEATEATISAIVGPQGAATTVEVAEGLTLNFTETNSSSDKLRQGSLIKAGEGILKISGNYGSLAGFTLSAGKIVTTAEAVVPMTEDETPVAKITAAEGSTLHSQTVDGVTTYQLTAFGPASWDDVTLEDLAGTDLAGISDAGLAALKTWAAGKGSVEVTAIDTINVNAFLLDVANEEAPTEFTVSEAALAAIVAGDMAALQAVYPNAKVTLETVEGLPETCFRVKLSLPTEPAAE